MHLAMLLHHVATFLERVRRSAIWPRMQRWIGNHYPKVSEFLGAHQRSIIRIAFGAVAVYALYSIVAYLLNLSARAELDTISLNVKRVASQSIVPSIEVSGTLEFYEKINIASKTSGRIEKFYVREGEIVRRGQTLVQLEQLPLKLELEQQEASMNAARSGLQLARERYANAKRAIEIKWKNIEKQATLLKELKAAMDKTRTTYDRNLVLYQEEGMSEEALDTLKTDVIAKESQYLRAKKDLEIARVGFRDEDIKQKGLRVPKSSSQKFALLVDLNTRIEKAEVEVAESQLRSAEAAANSTRILLNETAIVSPINGMVAARNSSVGEQVRGGAAANPTEAIMVLVDISKLYAVVNIREEELSQIKETQPLEFRVDVFPEEKFQGHIEIINPLIDDRTHTALIKALVENQEIKLRPGMFLRGAIQTGEAQSIIKLPISAIVSREGQKAWAFIVKNERILRTDIVTGRSIGDEVEILNGLSPGDIVAVEKLTQLREGTRVKPRFQEVP